MNIEVNKVLGAVLGTCLFAMGTGFLAELIYHPKPAGNAGYPLPGGGGEGEHGGGSGEAKKEEKKGDGVATLLASADPEKGKAGTKACQACHSFEKGGPNKIGPDLYDVVERKKGSHEGFDYSAGMKEKGGTWTYDDLDHFLTKPGDYIKGTKMAFGGIGSPQDRANVIAYLRTLSESPKPLPEAKKEEGKKDEAKKDEAKKDDKAAEGKKPEEGKKDDKAAEGAKKADDGKKAEGGGGDPIVAKVASADAAKGKDGTKACQACHSFDKGGPNKVGPDLWGVVGRKKGSHEGYSYSDGMKAKGGEWTLADLNQFLTKPADYVKGTKMGFPGIAKEDERVAVIAYLRTLADNPQPLPGAEKKDEGKKAEGDKKPEAAKEAPKEEAKPADAKPEEKKADEAKPEEKKAEEAKPAEAKPADKPAEAKPESGDAKPSSQDAPAATDPASKPNEGAEKKADDANTGVQPNNEKPAEDKPADEKKE